MFTGQDVVDLAMTRKGQKYVLGAKVHLANKDWSGPWDCAEFVAWACYHSYKAVIAVRPPNIQMGESYSGWWQEDAFALDADIPVAKAIATPGAILIRRPGYQGIKIGHVAISRGDNSTIEARGAAQGVAVCPNANARPWTTGFLVPGVSYNTAAPAPKIMVPKGLLQLASPFMRGQKVIELQNALLQSGINPGPVDGIFGNATATAVAAFQAQAGLTVDGVVGPETRKALGL